MKKRSRIFWKFCAFNIIIVTVVIALSSYVNKIIYAHYSLESARNVLKFNSESILRGIGRLMMNRDNAGVEELITDVSGQSSDYGDFRLVAHPSGIIVASRSGGSGSKLQWNDKPCSLCHDRGNRELNRAEIIDEVIKFPSGSRLLKVLAPISNENRCKNAECHAHADSPGILGFLETDYDLGKVDAIIAGGKFDLIITLLAALLLSTVILWSMITQLLEKPIHRLIAGTKKLAGNDLDFRFHVQRKDEFGMLEDSLNDMTSKIQHHETDLRKTKEYLEGIIENSADIIITVNPEGRIQTFNSGAEQTLGYKRQEIIGSKIETLFANPSERDAAIAQLRDTDNVRNYETRFLTKSGGERSVLLTLSRLRDPKGKPIGTMGISKDITEEKRLQKKLVQSEKFAAIGHTITGIQHTIRNMLNALNGGAYLLKLGITKNNRARLEQGWVMVEGGIANITRLSKNMLNYARDWKPELEWSRLEDPIRKLCESYAQTAVNEGIAFRFDIPGDLPDILCDPKLIHIVVMDIIANAVDACAGKEYASNESPEICLKTYLDEQKSNLRIEISDNGCGMSEDVLKDIFLPFFSTKMSEGTGLELSISKQIVNLHGGEITVKSIPGQGSVFEIVLPKDGPNMKTGSLNGKNDLPK